MQRNLNIGASIMRYFQIVAVLLAVAGVIAASMNLHSSDAATLQTTIKAALALFILISFLLITSIWLLSRRNLARRIDSLSATLARVSSGDLTARVKTSSNDEVDQLGNNLNLMLDKFESLIISINTIASELTQISGYNGEAAGRVIQAAQIQSKGVEQTSAAVNGIINSVDKVSDGVINLSGSAEIANASIREISDSINAIRQDVTVQSESIEEVSSSITEMAAVVEEIGMNVRSLMDASASTSSSIAQMDASNKQVEQNARETASISDEVLLDAELGKSAVEATIKGIDEIRHSSNSTYSSINALSGRVSAIGSILSVIDEIAEQTNLLALNSAIIAAQAGEHGKGFAIVAGEIKGLANRTRQSTMEIASLIEGVQEETAKAVSAIRQTEEKVSEGEVLSKRSGEALGKIVSGVQMASTRANEIARSTVEQAYGSQIINSAMKHVADMVEHIARSCQEASRTNNGIMKAVERMKSFTSQVNSSATSQQQIGADIATSTERMSKDLANIKRACSEQSDWSMQIVQSIDNVRESTQSNMESSRIMEKGVENLIAQIERLRKEIQQLHISNRGGSNEQ
ncbi:MAG TPA: HAMP domain-containing methyl-accepting chemotaxis protein [Geobacteraceae bacterium]|nr:HAMP domain-containing methyl-accepting chemotaxis protein [Geobacteraceae bacterium]